MVEMEETRTHKQLCFPVKSGMIQCTLFTPENPVGLVILTQGSGSCKKNKYNEELSLALNSIHMATVMVDLLTPKEAAEHSYRFDVETLASRLMLLIRHLENQEGLISLPMGIYGTGTGAAGALLAAARMPREIKALVCANGLTELVRNLLGSVQTPTLFLSDHYEESILKQNAQASRLINPKSDFKIVRRAELPPNQFDADYETILKAVDWFLDHLISDALRSNEAPLTKII
jgi:putative phosphoribosyl transferase